MSGRGDISQPEALALLSPGGALHGPLFASLLAKWMRAPAEHEPGARIGPYRLLSTLGHGGMAVVYLAERADGEFEQRVALKLVPPEGTVEPAVARELLRRERQILATLEHPHIARLLDGGTTPEGALWFAMEAVEGERIDRWCERRDASRRERLQLFLQVCDAVQFAHARLLVHRDLKPSNILVTATGEVKLLDFGIAAIAQPDQEHATPRALTPGHASPEQRRGEKETTASDIWQLGRLLHDLVPDARTSDADLRAIVARARQEDPARRYATVADFAADVHRALELRPVAARGGGIAYRAARFVSRHRFASAASLVAAIAFVTLAVGFTLRLSAERDAARREATRANATVDFMVGLFRGNEPERSRGQVIDARLLLDRGVARLEPELAGQPEVRARLLLAIAQIHDALGNGAGALAMLDQGLALARGAQDFDRAVLLDAGLKRAEIVLHMGKPLEVLAQLAALEPRLESDADRIRLLSLRAMAQLGSGDLDAALASEQEALALASAIEGPHGAEVAARNHDLGIILRAQHRYGEAAAAFEEAHAIYLALHGATHPLVAGAQKNLATALLELGELDRAEPLLLEAVERHRVLYGGKGAHYGGALRALAQLKAKRGDDAGAIEDLDQSLRLLEEAVGAESTAVAWTLQSRGAAYSRRGDAAAALADFARALAMRRKLLPADHLDIAASLSDVATQQWRLGNDDAARAAADESWRMRSARLGDADPRTLKAAALRALATAGAAAQAGGSAHFEQVRAQARGSAAAAEIEALLSDPERVLGARVAPGP